MNYNYYTTFISRIILSMKKLFLLMTLLPLTILGQNNNDDSTAKKIVNKFFEIGWKAGLNFDSSGDVLNLSDEFNSIDDAKGLINGFNIGLYTQIKLSKLYVRPELHFSKFGTNFENITVGQSRIELPVSLGFKLFPVLSAFGGLSYRLDLGNTGDFSLESISGDSSAGIHFGVRIHIGKFGIDARIERGISENEANLLSNNNLNIGKIDNRSTQASLGISLAF